MKLARTIIGLCACSKIEQIAKTIKKLPKDFLANKTLFRKYCRSVIRLYF